MGWSFFSGRAAWASPSCFLVGGGEWGEAVELNVAGADYGEEEAIGGEVEVLAAALDGGDLELEEGASVMVLGDDDLLAEELVGLDVVQVVDAGVDEDTAEGEAAALRSGDDGGGDVAAGQDGDPGLFAAEIEAGELDLVGGAVAAEGDELGAGDEVGAGDAGGVVGGELGALAGVGLEVEVVDGLGLLDDFEEALGGGGEADEGA